MKSIWNGRPLDLEGKLRASRPQPRADFVKALAAEVRTAPRERTRAGRFGLAIALSGLILVVLASFGGIGYASSAASHAVKKPTATGKCSRRLRRSTSRSSRPSRTHKPAPRERGRRAGGARHRQRRRPRRDDLAAAVHRARALDAAGDRPPAAGDRARPEDAQPASAARAPAPEQGCGARPRTHRVRGPAPSPRSQGARLRCGRERRGCRPRRAGGARSGRGSGGPLDGASLRDARRQRRAGLVELGRLCPHRHEPRHGTPVTYTNVTGTWVQPKVTCAAGESYSAFWVGLGGFSADSQALEQIGTESNCTASGKAVYAAWYEIVPAPSIPIRMKIRPGDRITTAVLVQGTQVILQITNRTTHVRVTKRVTVAAPDLTSAEWIAEAPSECYAHGWCQTLPLANFGTVAFTASAATGDGHRRHDQRSRLDGDADRALRGPPGRQSTRSSRSRADRLPAPFRARFRPTDARSASPGTRRPPSPAFLSLLRASRRTSL